MKENLLCDGNDEVLAHLLKQNAFGLKLIFESLTVYQILYKIIYIYTHYMYILNMYKNVYDIMFDI